MPIAIEGQSVLVVGAGGGIGRATVEAFARSGARVVAAGRRGAALDAAARAAGAESAALDFTDDEAVEAFFADRHPFDHVVVAAARTKTGPVGALPLAEARAAMDSKFFGAYRIARAAKIRDGGSLTFVSGFLSTRPSAASVLQGAINAALEALARGLALERAPVRVNTVSPGLVDTPLHAGMSPEDRQAMFARVVARPQNGSAVFAATSGYRYGRVPGLNGKVLVREEPQATILTEAVDCDGFLTASWSTSGSKERKRHACYQCPEKGCASYGKAIRRDVIEGEFETILRHAQPQPELFKVAAAMFRELWDRKQANVTNEAKALKAALAKIEEQIDHAVERIVEMTVPAVVRGLEAKVVKLDKEKLPIAEKMAESAAPAEDVDKNLGTALGFAASSRSLLETGRVEDRRAVLKPTFADPLRYKRGEGFRTADLALPFRVLGSFLSGEKMMARPKGFEPLTPRFVV